MRKRVTILLALALGAVLAFGIIGTGAEFVFNGSASQTINVGSLQLELDSDTPGATVSGNTVTCPAILVTQSSSSFSGGPVCNIKVRSIGTVPALNLSVFMSAATDGAHLDRFAVSATGVTPGGAHVLTTGSTPIGVATAFPASIDMETSWGYAAAAGSGLALDNNDMGKTVVVTYSLVSAE
jgi:hypothetical protein